EDITEASAQFLPGILKTATLGYDGKGQIRVKTLDELKAAFAEHGGVDCVLEKMVDLRGEISVIVCRLNDENVQTFDPAENIHENGILAYSIVPARLSADVQQQARQTAQRLADELDYVGVLAVEMFVVGDTHELLVNETAPRTHNSGHHTIDACAADQFQQQVRIMCNLPPADTKLLSPCCMANILGDVWQEDGGEPDWLPLQSRPNAHLHLYGKKTAQKGRKMGHFTVLTTDSDTAFQEAKKLHQSL
ncbi:ATP-grasp domain-containing protein, partial [Neisseria gonorrhoeae]